MDGWPINLSSPGFSSRKSSEGCEHLTSKSKTGKIVRGEVMDENGESREEKKTKRGKNPTGFYFHRQAQAEAHMRFADCQLLTMEDR